MDWDSENFEPTPVGSTVGNKWDGEDEDDNIKDNWEDDEDVKKDEPQKRQSAQSRKPKSRLEEKIEERERRERERKSKIRSELEKEIDTANMTPEQIKEEKLRRQKLQEEADLEIARETLGVFDDYEIDSLNPATKEDFATLGKAICQKILAYKKSEHFNDFMEEFFKDISVQLSSNELKKLKMNMDNMFNEKVKVEKAEKTKKTKGKGKAKIRVEQNDMVYDEFSAYTIDEYDDFM